MFGFPALAAGEATVSVPATAAPVSPTTRARKPSRRRVIFGGNMEVLRFLLAPAQSDEPADREPDHRGADRELAPVGADLASPVGELRNAIAEHLHRAAELVALALDVGADLIGASPG